MKMQYIEKKHSIHNWGFWQKELVQALSTFKQKMGCMPSYILANEHTLSKIDFLVNVTNSNSRIYKNSENKSNKIRLTHFIFEKQLIDFVFDNQIGEQNFVLAYDSFFENEKATETQISKHIRLAVA